LRSKSEVKNRSLSQVLGQLQAYELRHFFVQTLVIDSLALKSNPLKDPARRFNPVLVPRGNAPPTGWPVVVVLAGFTGNGPAYLNTKGHEANLVQILDQCLGKGHAPRALYVFPDAFTFWGGSQFINSTATGSYEDFIMAELVPALGAHFPVSIPGKKWAVVGGSSGGYGALHLASHYPHVFSWLAASAPDSGFQWSLLPDLYKAAPYLQGRSIVALQRDLRDGSLLRRSEAHSILNAVGMAACYSPSQDAGSPIEFDFPLDFESGELIPKVWRRWQAKDPVVFLKRRKTQLKKLSGIYLDVGRFDQYLLYYGARQIANILRDQGLTFTYVEFDGNHFDLHTRRPMIWQWLRKKLS
jgi:enterochelin esterase family protein